MPNRLAKESSPYLQQHQNNPVDWYPWGDEALSRAKAENKPILLSVGYSACHWCHVMEHESFENPLIAKLMNENFVSIKVDREERPDLDQIYQNVAQLMTRSGGWPLTVFLTPDLKPFFGGTYFPPDDRYGRPGFARVLQALAEAYRNEPEAVADNARRLTEAISSLEAAGGKGPAAMKPLSEEVVRGMAENLLSQIDWQNGGLGGAPKFPNAMIFSFLWRASRSLGLDGAREAVRLTLLKMAQGGIYDQLGGGFHRYSVDEYWSVPHFEKMLYDNGLLLKLYSEVLVSDHEQKILTDEERELYDHVISETCLYAMGEMQAPSGAFYSAQDADSEGVEGKYFVWDPAELKAELSEPEARALALRYGVDDAGNFEHGKTVLFLSRSIPEVAQRLGATEQEAREILDRARMRLLAARRMRVPPLRDDKVLAGWNGLMISGLCWAARALRTQERNYLGGRALEAARRAFRFVTSRMVADLGDGRLFSTFHERNAGSQARLNAYLDDYAFLAMSALDLARTSDREEETAEYLRWCGKWVDRVVKHFKDPGAGGYFFTSDDHESLIQRPKTLFDQAIPSGIAVTLECLCALSEIDPEGRGSAYRSELEAQFSALLPEAERAPYGMGEFCSLALLRLAGPVVVSGPGSEKGCVHAHIFRKPADPAQGGVLVCHSQTCSLPLSAEEARQLAVKKTLGTGVASSQG